MVKGKVLVTSYLENKIFSDYKNIDFRGSNNWHISQQFLAIFKSEKWTYGKRKMAERQDADFAFAPLYFHGDIQDSR